MVFSTNDESGTLARIDADGRRVHVLSGLNAPFGYKPSWAPSGREIAFVAQPAGAPEFAPQQLFIVSSRGGRARQITDGAGVGPVAWSRSNRIAYDDIGTRSIMAMDPSGRHRRTLFRGPLNVGGLDWSPDGRTLVFGNLTADRGPTLYVVGAGGGRVRRLLPAAFSPLASGPGYPAWSPDGRSIAFTARAASLYGNDSVFVVGADGRHVRRILTPAGEPLYGQPDWQPIAVRPPHRRARPRR